MKIARYEIDGAVHYGVLDGETLRRLPGSPFEQAEPTGATDALNAVRLLAPLDRPRIFGVGMNYVAHIKEMGGKTPEMPLIFMKPSTTVIGPDQAIVYPREGQNVHFEAELAVVIGRSGEMRRPARPMMTASSASKCTFWPSRG